MKEAYNAPAKQKIRVSTWGSVPEVAVWKPTAGGTSENNPWYTIGTTTGSVKTLQGLTIHSSMATSFAGYGYAISTPFNIAGHWTNPKMNNAQKIAMSTYEVGTAVGGIALAYGIANCWNPTGWASLIVAAVITVGYAYGAYQLGATMIEEYEEWSDQH